MTVTRRAMMQTLAATAAASAFPGAAVAQGQRRLGSANKAMYWVATVTPCNRNGTFDPGAMASIMQFHQSAGADGVTVLGTSGEFSSFSVGERKAILETAMRHKGGMNIILNPGTANITETIDLARHAQAAGADGLLVIPPYYFNEPPLDGLTRYYEMLFDATSLPINLYHIPGTSEVSIKLDLLRRLHRYPHLAGIKDSSGKADGYAAFRAAFPDLNMRTGGANLIEAAVGDGMGAILAEGNTFSARCARVYRTYRAGGDWRKAAQDLNAACGAVMKAEGSEAIFSYPHMKYMLSLQMGGGDWYARVPFAPLTDAKKASMKAAFERAGAMA